MRKRERDNVESARKGEEEEKYSRKRVRFVDQDRLAKVFLIKVMDQDDERETGMLDSGANIAITSREVADSLGLTIYQRRYPISIEYGKVGIMSEATHYVYMGPIIQEVNIVEGAIGTLITLNNFTARGWSVVFTDGLAEIIHQSGAVLFTCEQDDDMRLWNFDIRKIMALPSIETIVKEHQEQEMFLNQRYRHGRVQARVYYEYELEDHVEDDNEDESDSEQDNSGRQNRQWKFWEKEEPIRQKRTSRRTRRSMSKDQIKFVADMHRTNGHMSEGQMKQLVIGQGMRGLPSWLTSQHVSDVFAKLRCLPCELARMRRLPQVEGSGVAETVPGWTLSIDYQGPVHPSSMGADGVILIQCHSTGMLFPFLANTKTCVVECIDEARLWFKSHGHVTHKLRNDSGSVELSKEVWEKLANLGITQDEGIAPPGSQNLNPVERPVQEVFRLMAVLMMSQYMLTRRHWGAAIICTCDSLNSTPNKKSSQFGVGMTPIEACTHIKPSMNKLQFGEPLMILDKDAKDCKWGESKGVLAVYLTKNLRSGSGIVVQLMDKTEDMPVVRDQYLQYEIQGRKPTEEQMRELADTGGMQINIDGVMKTVIPHTPTKEDFSERWIRKSAFDVINLDMTPRDMPMGFATLNGQVRTEGQLQEMATTNLTPVMMQGAIQEPIVDELIGRRIRKDFGEEHGVCMGDVISFDKPWYKIHYPKDDDREDMTERQVRRLLVPLVGSVCMATEAEQDEEAEDEQDRDTQSITGRNWFRPMEGQHRALNQIESFVYQVAKAVRQRNDDNPTYARMMTDSELQDKWLPVVKMETAEFLKCCREVDWEDIPYGTEILMVMIDLRTKFDVETGEVDKLKARMNIMGDPAHMIRNPEDDKSFYAPTPKLETFMLMFAAAAHLGWHLSGFDVVKAFKNTPAEKRRYVTLPKELTGDNKKYFELLTVMHGLPEASRMWYEYLAKHLREKGYTQCVADPTSWVRWDEDECIIFTIHTDDGAVLSNSTTMEDKLKGDLKELVDITEQPTLEHHLGMHLQYNDDGSITITTPANCRKLIQAAFPDPSMIPTGVRSPMRHDWDEQHQSDAERCDYDLYMKILGLAIFETRTRVAIITEVSILSSRASVCTTRDMDAILRLVAYVAGSQNVGVTFHAGSPGSDAFVQLMYWCDASCSGPNPRMGWGSKLGGESDTKSGMVSASSFKDKHTTPLSPAEAELTIVKEVTKKAYWQRLLTSEWGLLMPDTPSDIFTDSLPVVDITFDYSPNVRKMQHRALDIDFIMQASKRNVIKTQHIPGKKQMADQFTKPVMALKHVNQLSGIQGASTAVHQFTEAMTRRKKGIVNMVLEAKLVSARRNMRENIRNCK